VRQATFARIQAERNRLQQQGELSKVTNETLLEAANTYIDLLTARRARRSRNELEAFKKDLLKRAEAGVKEGGAVPVGGRTDEMSGEAAAAAKLHQQATRPRPSWPTCSASTRAPTSCRWTKP